MSAAEILRQLRELMARRVDVHTVPGFRASDAVAHVTRLRLLNEQGAHFSPKVEGACGRILDAIQSNALRLASVRDADALLTFAATLDRGQRP
jgi:hypothetical protein